MSSLDHPSDAPVMEARLWDQGPQFVVTTVKSNGTEIVFGVYKTRAEAVAVAARLVEVGGNAHVVEVAP